MDIRLTMDTSDFERGGAAFLRQLPFATALALNRVASHGRSDVREDLPTHFVLRSKWVSGGVQVNRATKSHQVAEVGHRQDFMALHVEGGVKDPPTAAMRDSRGETVEGTAGQVAVPKAARPQPRSNIRGAKAARRLVKGGNRHFVAPLRQGHRLAVYRRRTRKKYPLQVMYVFSEFARINPRLPFQSIMEDAVRRRWPIDCRQALLDALMTAKKR